MKTLSKIKETRKRSKDSGIPKTREPSSGVIKNPRLSVGTLLSKLKVLLFKPSYLWVILVFAFLTRLYDIGSLGISAVELKNVDRVFLMSNPANFFNQDVSTNLYYFLQNIWGRFFGFSLTNMRIFSVFLGIFGLYIFFKFTEEWFNRRLAYIAAFLLSISSYYIFISRAISHEILYFSLVIFAFHTLTLAYRQKRKLYFVLSGLLFGIAFYASAITFTLAILLLISLIYFYRKNSLFFKSFIKEKILALSSGIIVAIPYLYVNIRNPNIFLSHFTLKPSLILYNINLFFSSLLFSAPRNYLYTLSTDRIFDPFVLLTFLAGLTYACLRIKRRKFYFIISWLAILTLIIFFEKDFTLASFIYILPIIFILSARIQTFVLEKWFKTFPFNKFARITMVLGIGFMFSLALTYNYQKVFIAWQKYPERQYVYNTKVASMSFGNNPIYLYKTGLTEQALESILKNGGNNKLIEIDSLKKIENPDKFILLTSPERLFEVKSKMKNKNLNSTYGADLALIKGE